VAIPVWHGTQQESFDLIAAITRNCGCEEDPPRCHAHRINDEQRTLDGLLFARWMRTRLKREEWTIADR
jgi:hypothetical protein